MISNSYKETESVRRIPPLHEHSDTVNLYVKSIFHDFQFLQDRQNVWSKVGDWKYKRSMDKLFPSSRTSAVEIGSQSPTTALNTYLLVSSNPTRDDYQNRVGFSEIDMQNLFRPKYKSIRILIALPIISKWELLRKQAFLVLVVLKLLFGGDLDYKHVHGPRITLRYWRFTSARWVFLAV